MAEVYTVDDAWQYALAANAAFDVMVAATESLNLTDFARRRINANGRGDACLTPIGTPENEPLVLADIPKLESLRQTHETLFYRHAARAGKIMISAYCDFASPNHKKTP